nr:hypothetical protein B0A51_16963 [Rachicladosporium sp. CCFEE 5018]
MSKMKRFTGLLNRTRSSNSDSLQLENPPVDSPEANASRSIRLFCESTPNANRDDDYLHLPSIVEAAESSPAAAAAAALQIKKYLAKEYSSKPSVQYNSIMLVRILADNPGPTFTRCFDPPFVKTVKELLRGCKDGSTQQILRETLDALEVNKIGDEGVAGLIAMWRKEKGMAGSMHTARPMQGATMNGGGRSRRHNSQHDFMTKNQLPSPQELASRVEEAKNTSKILLQLLQSTPKEEILNSELAREFNERCQSAQRNMQQFIGCDNPTPDDDTMLTLIETNEQLSLAGSRYQRVLLEARRALGINQSPPPDAVDDVSGPFATPAASHEQSESLFASAPTQRQPRNGFGAATTGSGRDQEVYQAPPGPPPQQQSQQPYSNAPASTGPTNDPFADPVDREATPNAATGFNAPSLTSRNPARTPETYASTPSPYNNTTRHNTTELNNAYTSSLYDPSSPVSPIGPNLGPHNNAGPTPAWNDVPLANAPQSNVPQSNAPRDATAWGAQARQSVAEIDGHSTIGRNDAQYGIREVEARKADRRSRVDVAGTGGLRGV